MGNLLNSRRAGARSLQFSILNEEFLVSVIHQIALITSLPFVHTARRYYRLNGLVRSRDQLFVTWQQVTFGRELAQTWSFRGSKSRNKVSVGEPAEGSLPNPKHINTSVNHQQCVCVAIHACVANPVSSADLYTGIFYQRCVLVCRWDDIPTNF